MNIIKVLWICIATPILAFCFYTTLVWLPYNIYAESVCLSKGYPETRVSVGLAVYCVTLDGAVTVKVDKQ